MSDGTEIAADVLEAINEVGRTIVAVQTVYGAYDPATSSRSEVETRTSVKAYVEDANSRDIIAGRVEVNGKKIIISASTLTTPPAVKDTWQFDSKSFAVMNIETYYLGEEPVAYQIWVNQG